MVKRGLWLFLASGVLAASSVSLAAGEEQSDWLAELLEIDESELGQGAGEDALWDETLVEEMVAAQAELETALAELDAWSIDGTLSGGTGWRSNVLNSSRGGVDSYFGLGEFDLFALKPGVGEKPQYVVLLFGEVRYYDDVPDLSSEHMGVAHAQMSKGLWGGLKGSASLQSIHSKQAFDASSYDFETQAVAITLWQPELRLALEKEVGGLGLAQGFFGACQSRYSEASENSETRTAGLGWSRSVTENSRASLTWERHFEDYASRVARFSSGARGIDSLLEIQANRWEAQWAYLPSEGALRKAQTKLSYGGEDDLVGDYYQRRQWEARQSFEWLWQAWRLKASAAIGAIDYSFRPAASDSALPRADENFTLSLELSRPISRSLSAYARYEQVDRDSNASAFAYASSSAVIGISLSKASGN